MGDEDKGWVLDSLVGFLQSPIWSVAILTFIENKSLIFESACEDTEEHTKIHEEYKNLVDFMLGSYMEDIGITEEQFEEVGGLSSSNVKNEYFKSLFEQVWAAEDYGIFKSLMIQKNLELQLQALDLLQKQYGIIPECYIPGADKLSEEEQAILEEVIRRSLEEHEALIATLDEETRDLERALADSTAERERLETQRQREREQMEKVMRNSLKETEEQEEEKQEEVAEVEVMEPTAPPEEDVSPEDLQRRQEYLKAQRDRLLALKKEERERQLNKLEETTCRPMSSRAARTVMSGSQIDPQTLEFRRTLVQRLKQEVINKD